MIISASYVKVLAIVLMFSSCALGQARPQWVYPMRSPSFVTGPTQTDWRRYADTHSTLGVPPPLLPARLKADSPVLTEGPSQAELERRREEARRAECSRQAVQMRGPAGIGSLGAPIYYRGCVDRNPWLQMLGVNANAAQSAGQAYKEAQVNPAPTRVQR